LYDAHVGNRAFHNYLGGIMFQGRGVTSHRESFLPNSPLSISKIVFLLMIMFLAMPASESYAKPSASMNFSTIRDEKP